MSKSRDKRLKIQAGDEMSYCRFGPDSDVYVIESGDENGDSCWVCFCGDESFQGSGRMEMLGHLAEHIVKGDKVPVGALNRLWQEIMEELDEQD